MAGPPGAGVAPAKTCDLARSHPQSKLFEEINEISKTEEFEKLNSMKEENQKLQDKIEKLKSDALTLFLPLDKSLRKFNKISQEEIIQDYIDNPLSALRRDKDFRIFNILKQIEAALIDDQLDIKEEKKDKTLESIKNISEESLKNLLSEYESLINEQQSVKEKFRAMPSLMIWKSLNSLIT